MIRSDIAGGTPSVAFRSDAGQGRRAERRRRPPSDPDASGAGFGFGVGIGVGVGVGGDRRRGGGRRADAAASAAAQVDPQEEQLVRVPAQRPHGQSDDDALLDRHRCRGQVRTEFYLVFI